MRNTLIAIITCTFLLSSGMAQSDSPASVTPVADAAKPALSEEARQALAKAEADIKEAKNQKALWTTAEDALKKAQAAAAQNDSAATLKFSKTASEHVRLGLIQKTYPLTK